MVNEWSELEWRRNNIDMIIGNNTHTHENKQQQQQQHHTITGKKWNKYGMAPKGNKPENEARYPVLIFFPFIILIRNTQ